MRQFGYLKDPLCVISLMAYAVNQWIVKPRIGFCNDALSRSVGQFFQFHFNDFLLMPAALPVVLWIQRITGLRREECPPTWREMFFHLAVWSVVCKYVGPYRLHIGVPDWRDLVYYTLGGVVACLLWNRTENSTWFKLRTAENCP